MLFELRAYDFAPGVALRYLDLFQHRGLQHVTRHLPMAGYWMTDTGPLNRLYHLWIYESLSERTALRARLMADRDWTDGFVPPGFAMIGAQHSTIMRMDVGSVELERVVLDRHIAHAARAPGAPLFSDTNMVLCFGKSAPDGTQLLARWTAVTGQTAGDVVSLHVVTELDRLLSGEPTHLHLLRPCAFSPLR